MKGWAKAALYSLVAKHGRIVKGTGKGLRFDPSGGGIRYLMGPIIPYEEEALCRYLANGSVFYDIGANVGYYAVVAAKLVGESGHVYAFEPFPQSAETVERNARINGFKHVSVHQKAMSDKSGEMHLTVTENSVTHRLSKEQTGVSVPVITVDEFVQDRNNRPPDLVLIDVEGAEFQVLQGMRDTMRTYRPIVIAEIHWKVDEMIIFQKTLSEMGYVVQKLDGGDLPSQPTWYHAIFTPQERQRSA